MFAPTEEIESSSNEVLRFNNPEKMDSSLSRFQVTQEEQVIIICEHNLNCTYFYDVHHCSKHPRVTQICWFDKQ